MCDRGRGRCREGTGLREEGVSPEWRPALAPPIWGGRNRPYFRLGHRRKQLRARLDIFRLGRGGWAASGSCAGGDWSQPFSSLAGPPRRKLVGGCGSFHPLEHFRRYSRDSNFCHGGGPPGPVILWAAAVTCDPVLRLRSPKQNQDTT